MAKIIAVFNIKGGVGKTTSAVNLAYASAANGNKTLLWDFDHQGAASFSLGFETKLAGGVNFLIKDSQKAADKKIITKKIQSTGYEGFDILPADDSLRLIDAKLQNARQAKQFMNKTLTAISEGYDTVIIDCAPGLSLLNEALLSQVNIVLAPVMPTVLAVRTLDNLQLHLKANKSANAPKIRAFFTLMDKRKKLHRSLYNTLCVKRKTLIFPEYVPYSTDCEQMLDKQQPIAHFAASSAAAVAYDELWQRLARLRV